MKRVYFTEAPPKKRVFKVLMAGGAFLLVAAGVLLAALHLSGYSETLFDLMDSQQAAAQAGEPATMDDNAGRPDQLGEAAGAVGTPGASGGPGAAGAPGTEPAPSPETTRVLQEDSDAAIFTSEKMQEIQSDILASLQVMREIQKALDVKAKERREQAEEDQMRHLAKLIKIVNSMRPEDAARMLDKFENDLAVKILASLTGGKASKIMAGMKPEKAALLGAMMVALKPEKRLLDVMRDWQRMVEDEEAANAEN